MTETLSISCLSCWPLVILAVIFGAGIGALFATALNWGTDLELRMAHHTRSEEIDEHARIGEKDAD